MVFRAMAASKFSLISLLFFFFIVPSVSSLEFDLSIIGPEDANRFINITGDAYISSQGIQVTPDERNMALSEKTGRATYIQPLHLWDNSTGMLTNFSTNFSFLIYSDNQDCYADGLAFFLAPVGSNIPEINVPGGRGGYLGLTNNTLTANASVGDPVVAVEFDTCSNVWDPEGAHVGIDINSVQSVNTISWMNNFTQEVVSYAWITYDSTAKYLTVEFTGSLNENLTSSLSYAVDLREYLPEWVTFGFSGATGSCFERNNVKSWGFYSSLPDNTIEPNTADAPSNKDAEPPSVQESQIGDGTKGTRKKPKTGMVTGIVVCISVVLILLAIVGVGHGLRKQKNKEDELELEMTMDNEFEKGSGAKKFSYTELTRATKYFSEEEKLGEGGFGSVYRGFLRDVNSYVAVKRVSRGSKQGIKEYASEVKIISQLRHRNLVQLIGWCHEKGELLLVYEFMPNGSLDSHLFKERSLLSWEARYRIAQGLALALLYLHEEWEQCVVHRDIKSSNIMLDSSFNAKLGDFGLARLVDHEKGSQTTVLAGTMGYMAPECAITGKASKESDVYSFGIVALEIACGRKSIDLTVKENQTILVQWIWELYGRGKLLEGADPKLGADFDEEQMEHLMIVGLWCAHPDSTSQPSIRQAIHVLNSEAHLPNLPPKMPVLTYATPAFTAFNAIFLTQNDDADDDRTALRSSTYNSNTGSLGFTASSKSACSSALLPHS